MNRALAFLLLLLGAESAYAATAGDRIVLANDFVQRELMFDGHVWRTAQFARADGSDSLVTQSDEFHIFSLDDHEVTLDDFEAVGDPIREQQAEEQRLTIHYAPRQANALPADAPTAVTITYSLRKEPYLRKTVALVMKEGQNVDRLEVERFSIAATANAQRGGRGEPVFVNGAWFFGIEYPAFYSRHTDGNTPRAASGPYDKFGNFSFIDLAGRDVERHPRDGLIRLMHFPGQAKKLPEGNSAGWGIVSKTAVAGVGAQGDSIELAFLDYLNTIRRPVRSFIHYNNYQDKDGADLSVANFVNTTFATFKKQLDPFGVRIDAMVPDDGWQNRKSIYELNPAKFPHGLDDMAALGDALQQAGTHLGLWIALNGYNSDIDWGRENGFTEAQRNERFTRFKRYYSLSNPKYNALLRERITELMRRCHIQYFKHDFNEMCDLGEGNGHLPTDRHGHEAEVDAELGILQLERTLNPEIYQNITNWIWFSPWWLQQGNNVWMLSSDSAEFLGWPEVSLLVRAAAYRDVNIYPVWHNPATRPLVPISHLMTHGIIYHKSKYSGASDTLQDFSDYVMMYYMRGLQLKEWYINPLILTDGQWQVLGRHTRWSEEHLHTLANSVFVGGNPAKGNPYGYVCWNGDRGILSVRNPSPGESEIVVPFDQSVWFRGASGREFQGRVVYPFQGPLGKTFKSGEAMRLQAPGYSLMVIELSPGRGADAIATPSPPEVKSESLQATVTIPKEKMQRCDLVVILHTPAEPGKKTAPLPEVKIGGNPATPTRSDAGPDWGIVSVNVQHLSGQQLAVEVAGQGNAEGWLIMDRPVAEAAADNDPRLPMPVGQGYRRQTVPLFQATGR